MFENLLPVPRRKTEMSIQNGTTSITQVPVIQPNKVTSNNYELSDRVNKLIKWATKNVAPKGLTDTGVFHYPERLRNLMEKVACWYEMRYTRNEINQMCYYGSSENINMDEILFHEKLSDGQTIWSQGFDKDTFLETLEHEEKYLLYEPAFPSRMMEGLSNRYQVSFRKVVDSKTGQENIVAEFPTLRNPDDLVALKNKVSDVINEYSDDSYLHHELLNCIMYRIIDHDPNRVGPRRAMLFAKEFGTDIRIPMQYGVDTSDPGLKEQIEFYLSLGGSEDVDCLINYCWRAKKNQPLEVEPLRKIMARVGAQRPSPASLESGKVKVLTNQNNPSLPKKV